MKKYFNILIIALVALVSYSCSEDLMDSINKDRNHSTDVASRLILTDMITSSAFTVTGSDLAFYASSYVEHNVGVYGQLYNAEIRTVEPTSSTTYNNSWNAIYSNLLNLKEIMRKCSEGGSEEGNYVALGAAQTLSAYNLAILTDLFGDVPFSEALQPGVIFTPQLDKQEIVYDSIFNLLTAAVANFANESTYPSLGNQDLLYGGDAVSWAKFANGLLARYTMRMSHISPDYDAVISYSEKSFANAGEQAQFNYGSSAFSPFYQFGKDRDYFGASESLHDKLVLRNDPRDTMFFKPHKDAETLEFAPNGTPQQKQGVYGVSALSVATAPTYLMSYHEVEFLKAEAYARSGKLDSAKLALEKAIAAAFTKVNVGLKAEDAKTYYDSEVAPKLSDQNSALREIMVQKYIAFYEEEAVEAYNDIRRLMAMGQGGFVQLTNPLNNSKFPLRFTYGAEDVTTNENVRGAYGDGSYAYTEKVWWAGGSR